MTRLLALFGVVLAAVSCSGGYITYEQYGARTGMVLSPPTGCGCWILQTPLLTDN